MDLENMDLWDQRELAENPNTPVDVLRDLATEEDGWIRRYVATNPSTPLDVLRDLAKDEELGVRWSVTLNSNASSKILVMMFEYEKSLREPDEDVIKVLYAHKNFPAFAKRVLETLFGEMLP